MRIVWFEEQKKNNDTKEIRTPASYDSRNPC